MQHPSRSLRTDRLIIALVGLATALICALGTVWYLDRDNRWFRIVSPQNETATAVLALDRGLNVYVRTTQGNLYLCGGRTWRDTCRRVSADEVPLVKVPAQWRTCPSPFPESPPLPGEVVDAIEVGRCSEAATYSKIVILKDGTLWQWRKTLSWVNSFAVASASLAGLGLGIVGALAVRKVAHALRSP